MINQEQALELSLQKECDIGRLTLEMSKDMNYSSFIKNQENTLGGSFGKSHIVNL